MRGEPCDGAPADQSRNPLRVVCLGRRNKSDDDGVGRASARVAPNTARTLAPRPNPLYIRRLCMDEHRLKKIRLRAWRRGFREADLILGPFADRYVPSMTPAQLDAFEALMEEADQDIYDWYLGRSPVADHIDPEVFALLQAFDPSGRPAGG